jgi:hypothetical protein
MRSHAAFVFFSQIETENGHELVVKRFRSGKIFNGYLDVVEAWLHEK